MTIEEYMRLRPVEGTSRGIESPWLDLCSIELPSGRLLISDPSFWPDRPLVVDLGPGTYPVQVKLIDFEEHRCVARLRVTNASDAALAEVLGEVSVDFSQLGVVDFERMQQMRELTAEEVQQLWENLDPDALYGTLLWDPEQGIDMPYVITGFGDGRYSVRALQSGEQRVGVEVDFMEHTKWE